LVGALVGIFAALWYAPKSGEETRQEIAQRGDQIRHEAEHAATEARYKVEGPRVDSLITEAKSAARDYKNTQLN